MGLNSWVERSQAFLWNWTVRRSSLTKWFQIDAQEMSRILEQVRCKLSTTEVLLLGKPQTGKSSVIRGLTGVSEDIIGQGFRPHTTHTQHYFFPTDELPLFKFIDTIGVGENRDQSPQILEALQQELEGVRSPDSEAAVARVIVVTAKVNDFAIDFLVDILKQVKTHYPHVPCVLALTCLHELYPNTQTDHPPYPPDLEVLQRSILNLSQQFEGLCDRITPIDFTLDADGYTPVFYGLEAFVDALADLLPTAEANMIHQLLAQSPDGEQISQLYRNAGRRYILPFSLMAATLAAVPLPLATMPVLTALQVTMVNLLGQLYGQRLSLSQAGGVASAIAGGFLAQTIGRELIKFVPGIGSVIAASWAGAYTWALGEGACVYFGDLMGGRTPDPKKIQATMNEAFQYAQQRLKGAATTSPTSEQQR